MKYRILVRVHTARRDAAPLALYQRILERMECSVVLVNGNSFPTWLKLWKPHAVVVGTFGQGEKSKKMAPWTKVIVFDQEGFKNPGMTHAEQLVRASSTLDNIDLVLVWGKKIIEEFKEHAPHINREHFHVVGNPKLDLVRFLPERFKDNQLKSSIGVVCRFPTLNDYEGRSLLRTLPNPGNVDRVIVQVKSFGATIDVVRAILSNTDFRVSLRPHPGEQIESYQEYKVKWFNNGGSERVSIDSSLDFPSWAVNQRALLSPSSTSFLEAYLLGIPVINLDNIANTAEQNRNYAPVVSEWQEGGVLPSNVDDVCRLLNEDTPNPPRIEEIEKQLVEYCDWQSNLSACFRAAKWTTKLLQESQFPTTFHLPTQLVNLRDELRFKRTMLRNPLHHNFSYQQGYHEIPSYYDEMADRILAESSQYDTLLNA